MDSVVILSVEKGRVNAHERDSKKLTKNVFFVC